MPDLESANQPYKARKEKKRPGQPPKNPLNSRIYNKNCFLRCLFNIPHGTMMLVLPGAVILLMGSILLPWTSFDDTWSDGTQQAGLLFVVFGGVLFIAGLTYGCYYYFKYQPKRPTVRTVSPHPAGKDGVQLVGMYRIQENGLRAPLETYDNPSFVPTIS